MSVSNVSINKYIDLLGRYAIYGENGYYVDSHVINRIIVDELKLSMSFDSIEEFANNCEISITEEEIKDFLNEKMDEEELTLRKELEKPYKPPLSDNPLEWTEEEIHREARALGTAILKRRYTFESSSLEYFKTYISCLKEKCHTLFEILEDLSKIKQGEISEDGWGRIVDLDFHINDNGDIYVADVCRLSDAIIDNVRDLYEKVNQGNNPETYLTFKESKYSMGKDGASKEKFIQEKKCK